MTPDEAADLAARTLAAIDFLDAVLLTEGDQGRHRAADRERVASDLEGVQDHNDGCLPCPDAARYADGLRRTAALYGVTA